MKIFLFKIKNDKHITMNYLEQFASICILNILFGVIGLYYEYYREVLIIIIMIPLASIFITGCIYSISNHHISQGVPPRTLSSQLPTPAPLPPPPTRRINARSKSPNSRPRPRPRPRPIHLSSGLNFHPSAPPPAQVMYHSNQNPTRPIESPPDYFSVKY